MKLEVGQRYSYDPNHPHAIFLDGSTSGETDFTVVVTHLDELNVYYKYIDGWTSQAGRKVFIRAVTPLSSLEKELY